MLVHEKKAFWKFFSIYFGSVALLILAAGYFYYGEQQKVQLEKEHFSMIEHIRKLKMDQHDKHTEGIEHTVSLKKMINFNINNFEVKEDYFIAYLPYDWKGRYYLVKKSKKLFHEHLLNIKIKIIALQLSLLFLFAFISYHLSMRALVPMQEAIVKLDSFSKDLIHDLNTPVTSILLNTKILERTLSEDSKALQRIKRSAQEIGELHMSLTTLLEEDTFVMQNENIFEIVDELVNTQKSICGDIRFIVESSHLEAKVNKNAFKQILSNVISNACKYNKKKGSVKIYAKNRTLYIQDTGIGISNPENIFQRNYKEQKSGHGIGLDIAKRLCDSMDIDISASSTVGEGTLVRVKF